jgi:hypothetical protein
MRYSCQALVCKGFLTQKGSLQSSSADTTTMKEHMLDHFQYRVEISFPFSGRILLRLKELNQVGCIIVVN